MPKDETVLGTTESVCPVCLSRIEAQRVAEGGDVYLLKTCPEHGSFRTIIWRGQPAYSSWAVNRPPAQPASCAAQARKGCPYDCGLCPEHRQQTCCVLLEVTGHCNLNCPVCFAGAGVTGEEPDLQQIESWYRMLMAAGGPFNIQLSGGEPTLRDDLPEIITLGKSLGFSFFQLNTNGIRLADDRQFAKRLKAAGLSCVFLQFDGTDDAVYQKIRGARLLETKLAAIERCAELELGVVLVPTLVPGINTASIGDLLRFALERLPAVRGVHFQPVSYFGRYPQIPADADRLTLPEVITEIERQTGGKMKAGDLRPPQAENAYCSFHGNFLLQEDGNLVSWGKQAASCCGTPRPAGNKAGQARKFVAKRWSASGGKSDRGESSKLRLDSMDAFLERVDRYSLSVSGMGFQDAWTLDLERLKDCFIHVVAPDGRIIPFCAYNLTNQAGQPLHRPREGLLTT